MIVLLPWASGAAQLSEPNQKRHGTAQGVT